MAADRKKNESLNPDGGFESTQWHVVLAAGHPSSPQSSEALASLCQSYWYPLYAYARRRFTDTNDAQDATQEFFSVVLDKNYVAVANPERGKFRAFLLTAFKHFLANEWKKARRQKRGGSRTHLSLDFESGDSRYDLEPTDKSNPEQLYDRQWAQSLVNRAMTNLRDEFERSGKRKLLDHLTVFLSGATRSYSEAAKELGITEGAAKAAAHRLRRRYREILRTEIAQTVTSPEDIDDEIHDLFAALGP